MLRRNGDDHAAHQLEIGPVCDPERNQKSHLRIPMAPVDHRVSMKREFGTMIEMLLLVTIVVARAPIR